MLQNETPLRENNWVHVIIQFVDNLSEHQKNVILNKFNILNDFNILIFKYCPYLKNIDYIEILNSNNLAGYQFPERL